MLLFLNYSEYLYLLTIKNRGYVKFKKFFKYLIWLNTKCWVRPNILIFSITTYSVVLPNTYRIVGGSLMSTYVHVHDLKSLAIFHWLMASMNIPKFFCWTCKVLLSYLLFSFFLHSYLYSFPFFIARWKNTILFLSKVCSYLFCM